MYNTSVMECAPMVGYVMQLPQSHQPTISLSSVSLSNPSASPRLFKRSQAESLWQLASDSAAHIIDTNGDGSLV